MDQRRQLEMDQKYSSTRFEGAFYQGSDAGYHGGTEHEGHASVHGQRQTVPMHSSPMHFQQSFSTVQHPQSGGYGAQAPAPYAIPYNTFPIHPAHPPLKDDTNIVDEDEDDSCSVATVPGPDKNERLIRKIYSIPDEVPINLKALSYPSLEGHKFHELKKLVIFALFEGPLQLRAIVEAIVNRFPLRFKSPEEKRRLGASIRHLLSLERVFRMCPDDSHLQRSNRGAFWELDDLARLGSLKRERRRRRTARSTKIVSGDVGRSSQNSPHPQTQPIYPACAVPNLGISPVFTTEGTSPSNDPVSSPAYSQSSHSPPQSWTTSSWDTEGSTSGPSPIIWNAEGSYDWSISPPSTSGSQYVAHPAPQGYQQSSSVNSSWNSWGSQSTTGASQELEHAPESYKNAVSVSYFQQDVSYDGPGADYSTSYNGGYEEEGTGYCQGHW